MLLEETVTSVMIKFTFSHHSNCQNYAIFYICSLLNHEFNTQPFKLPNCLFFSFVKYLFILSLRSYIVYVIPVISTFFLKSIFWSLTFCSNKEKLLSKTLAPLSHWDFFLMYSLDSYFDSQYFPFFGSSFFICLVSPISFWKWAWEIMCCLLLIYKVVICLQICFSYVWKSRFK